MPEFQQLQYILEQTTTYKSHAIHRGVPPHLERSTVLVSEAVFTKFSRSTNIIAFHLSQTTSIRLSKFRTIYRNVEVKMAVHDWLRLHRQEL